MASFSYVLIERRFLRLKRNFEGVRTSLAVESMAVLPRPTSGWSIRLLPGSGPATPGPWRGAARVGPAAELAVWGSGPLGPPGSAPPLERSAGGLRRHQKSGQDVDLQRARRVSRPLRYGTGSPARPEDFDVSRRASCRRGRHIASRRDAAADDQEEHADGRQGRSRSARSAAEGPAAPRTHREVMSSASRSGEVRDPRRLGRVTSRPCRRSGRRSGSRRQPCWARFLGRTASYRSFPCCRRRRGPRTRSLPCREGLRWPAWIVDREGNPFGFGVGDEL